MEYQICGWVCYWLLYNVILVSAMNKRIIYLMNGWLPLTKNKQIDKLFLS